MVVWLFAGGGESEVQGLVPFLRKHFSLAVYFDRKTPVRKKPGPKIGKKPVVSHGKTGKSLAQEVRLRLQIALKNEPACDLILVLDDLDCKDPQKATESLKDSIFSGMVKQTPYCIGLAAPEIEIWIVSDWENTFSVHPSFAGKRQKTMKYRLAHTEGLNFSLPESFGNYDPERDSCDKKLSECIIEASIHAAESREVPFSKARHTPEMMTMLNPQNVCTKCPLFRHWWNRLTDLTKIGEARPKTPTGP
jgi:hypothetical protein